MALVDEVTASRWFTSLARAVTAHAATLDGART
jgi:hypothetical protein